MDFEDESDLTSLEDEDEQDDAAARNVTGLHSDSASNSSSVPDDVAGNGISTSRKGVQKTDAPPQLSPSRIGSGIARPAPAAGLKTYASRKPYPRAGIKEPQAPKSSPPSRPFGNESPLTPLTSSSPRKRRGSASAQQSFSSPSKRAKSRNGESSRDVHELRKKSASSHRMTTNGNGSPLSPPSISTNRKEKGKQAVQSKAQISSVSATRPRRCSLPPKPDAWSLKTLGILVWVRVDRRNAVIDDVSVESLWWPARIEPAIGRQKALRVRVFSPPAGSSTSVLVNIERPSPLNIVSYKEHSFTANSFWSLPSSSSRSRPVGFENLKSRWEAACKEIIEEDTRVHDGFPSSLAGILSQPMDNSEEVEHDIASRASPEHVVGLPSKLLEKELWLPPPPDPNVTVPGEHVLSTTITKGYMGRFYPAEVIAYVAPANPAMPPKYTVHFMDHFREDVTRDMFYIYEQEEFGTCKLGDFESAESLYERDGEDDLDEDLFTELTDHIVIPEPPLLPAPPPQKFCELTMLEQSSYIIPILKKITENNYKPAEERISAFLNGGRKRVKVSREAPQKGVLTRLELNHLARIIKCWALGIDSSNDEMRDVRSSYETYTRDRPEQVPLSPPEEAVALREVMSSPDDLLYKETTSQVQDMEKAPSLPPSSLAPSSTADESPSNTPKVDDGDDHNIIVPASADETEPFPEDHRFRDPQDGAQAMTDQQLFTSASNLTCLSFNDLLSHDKIHFCTDVLLKEAVIQLLLWRAGKRRVPELLSETEEKDLHESGSNLASEFDIAHIVKDLRMKKEKFLQARMLSKPQISTGGTRSRPRKI